MLQHKLHLCGFLHIGHPGNEFTIVRFSLAGKDALFNNAGAYGAFKLVLDAFGVNR